MPRTSDDPIHGNILEPKRKTKEVQTGNCGLQIFNLNVRSIRKKGNLLNIFLHTLNYPEIVCLTETWLSTNEAKTFKIDKYRVANYYCRENTRGGGVAILVREDLSFSVKDITKTGLAEQIFEATSVVVSVKNINITVNCLYRSPDAILESFIVSLEKLLTYFLKTKGPKFICGDFNCNFLLNNQSTCDLLNLLSSFGYNKCFTEHSRVQKDSRTLIDNVFSDIDTDLISTKTIDNIISDHNAQLLSFDLPQTGSNIGNVRKRDFSDENKNYFQFLLAKEMWQEVYLEPDVNKKFEVFHNTFSSLFNIAFPVKVKRNRKITKKKPWITRNIIEEGIFIRDLYKQTKLSNNPDLKIRYNILKINHQENIKNSKKAYYENKIINSTNKCKTMWGIVRENTNVGRNKKQLPSTIINLKNEILTKPQNIANGFNTNFINSVSELTSTFNFETFDITNIQEVNNNTMYLMPITEIEVADIINSVCKKKSSGPDDVPCCLIKEFSTYLISILTYLINLSFENGQFPQQLKAALIIPVHKKNDLHCMENYRPIALLSIFSKIYEKAFEIRLNSFLIKYHLLTPRQYGFCKKKSTQDAVLSFYEKILHNFDNKLLSAGIFFDLSRAFDTISHKLLLKKLEIYGIRGPALEWIKSYLLERTQTVKVVHDGIEYLSDSVNVLTGVPQGSVLGPLLFIIFVNDLVTNLNNCFLTLFADDTSSIITAANVDLLSKNATICVDKISQWCHNNGLILNQQKTVFLMFSPIRTKLDFSLLVRGNRNLQQKELTKFLGVHMDMHMSWEAHIENLTKRLASLNFALLQMRDTVDADTLKMFYYGCIHSVLQYCILCWGNSSGISKVFILQKRIVRSMFKLDYNTSCRDSFKQHGILTIYCIYILQSVCFVRKNIDNLLKCGEVNKYSTRSEKNIYVPPHRLEQTKRGPFISSIKMYNHLPQIIKDASSFMIFKKLVKRFLAERCFYSYEEYYIFA